MKKFIGRFLVALIGAVLVAFFLGQFVFDSVIGICVFAAVIVAVLTTCFGIHREEIDALTARVEQLEKQLAEHEEE